MMARSFVCVVAKSGPVATIAKSSMNRNLYLPNFVFMLSSRGVLFIKKSTTNRESPWSSPFSTLNGLHMKSSKTSTACLYCSLHCSQEIYSISIPMILISWYSLSKPTLRNAPLMSSKRAVATSLRCQASLIVLTIKWMESVVLHPGLPPKVVCWE